MAVCPAYASIEKVMVSQWLPISNARLLRGVASSEVDSRVSVLKEQQTKTSICLPCQPGCPSMRHMQHMQFTFRECLTDIEVFFISNVGFW